MRYEVTVCMYTNSLPVTSSSDSGTTPAVLNWVKMPLPVFRMYPVKLGWIRFRAEASSRTVILLSKVDDDHAPVG